MTSTSEPATLERTDRIRQLNDQLRRTGTGGRVVLTRGVSSMKPETVAHLLRAVAAFDDFNTDNDPHGEHDCAMVDAEAERLLFKIDYYATDLERHSPDPADPKLTVRVMTVMLAEEY